MKRGQTKIISGLLAVGMMATLCCLTGTAQVIYYNDFTAGNNGVSIEGTAPTMANDFAGGSSGALWNVVSNNVAVGAWMNQDGTIGRIQNSVLLPFTPESGYTYTLTGEITFTGDPGNWLSLGFAANNPADSAAPRFIDAAITGNPWSLFRPGTGNGGVQLYFSRTGLVGSQVLIPTTYPNTQTISMILDATGPNWILSEFVNDVEVTADYTYTSGNPTIHSVGFGQTTLASDAASAGHQWLSLSLSAEPAPEPSALVLTGFGLAGLFALRRRN